MSSELESASEQFESHVPHADATFLILKAHLVLERRLLEFIQSRVPGDIYDEIAKQSEGSFAGRWLIARALAARDEVPPENMQIIWPALKYLGALRNQVAHNLEHSGSSVEDKMRRFVELVDPTRELYGHEYTRDHLYFVFRQAALHLNFLLALPKAPLSFSDVELDREG